MGVGVGVPVREGCAASLFLCRPKSLLKKPRFLGVGEGVTEGEALGAPECVVEWFAEWLERAGEGEGVGEAAAFSFRMGGGVGPTWIYRGGAGRAERCPECSLTETSLARCLGAGV